MPNFIRSYHDICTLIDEVVDGDPRASLTLKRELIKDGRVVLDGVEYRLTEMRRLAAPTEATEG